MKKLMLAFLSLAFAAACGGVPNEKAGKNPNEKPPQEKLSAFEGALDSVGRIESAVALLHNQSVSVNDSLVTEIKNKINTPDCTITFNRPSVTSGSRISELKISGASCAVKADYVVSYQMQNDSTMAYSLKADLKITDPLLKEKNLIYEMNLRGNGRISSLNNELASRLSYSGTLTSTEAGKISVQVKQSENANALNPNFSAKGTTAYTLNFPSTKKIVNDREITVPGYQIEVKRTKEYIQNKDKSRYTLNDTMIDRSTYESYLDLFGMLAMPN